ncbi:sugar-binding transcriptional regulator [Brevibacillus fulvus]|uniref:Central glycolytic genes regulator n=1 Tax=Brevibacillus fulvus TaxID=1125967 RepID=A0A939BU33_9BACL|nr:sugar-binding domain-containing protein [Brevibacillus fulvus]MBM7592128.1 central glycolytic genes regulator [Brevibacillus fulvus]
MRELIEVQRKLLPDLVEVLRNRYTLLQTIAHLQPIGRRALSQVMNTTERILRAEVDLLKEMGLLHVAPAGMSCSEEGMRILEQLEPMADDLFGLNELASQLQHYLQINRVVVVQGDSDQAEWVKQELGRMGARLLKQYVREGDVIAVTGGSTIASVSAHLTPSSAFRTVQFVPARGGLGEKAELQANSLVSSMAAKTGASYRLLHVPDRLPADALQTLKEEPQIMEVLSLLHSARIVLHGIGEAIKMAQRRRYDEEELAELRELGAVSEAFGYYFNEAGEIVHRMETIGLQLEDVQNAEVVISIAGGASKAKAILSFAKQSCQNVLITDEGAARAILGKE